MTDFGYSINNYCSRCRTRYPKSLQDGRTVYITNGRRYCGDCGVQLRTCAWRSSKVKRAEPIRY